MEKYISTSTMKYYFAVDTKYVTKKIMLLLWPFSHQVRFIDLKTQLLISLMYKN